MRNVTFLLGLFVLSAALATPAVGQKLTAEQAAEKIKAATPADLPQTPVVKKGRPDTWDLGLKGKVKQVVTQVGEVGKLELLLKSKYEFDKDGASLKHIWYDEYGNPASVTVYGYIDGKRVATAGYIDYDYNASPPPPPAWVRDNANAKRDPRYFYAYEADYDAKGEPIEKRQFGNDGKMTTRTVYVRNGAKREQTRYDGRGEARPGLTETFDEAGNVIETVLPIGNFEPIINQYKYELFDAQGNWTRRIATTKSRSGTSTQAEVRMITYYSTRAYALSR
jgi:hypothetical protein